MLIEGVISALTKVRSQDIHKLADACTKTIGKKCTIHVFGNGGSHAIAQHFAAELIGSFESRRARPIAALVHGTPVDLSAIANDFGELMMFARSLEAHVSPGDTVIAMTTSGKSANILQALKLAGPRNHATWFALTGSAGLATPHPDIEEIRCKGETTAVVQHVHLAILHSVAELLENAR